MSFLCTILRCIIVFMSLLGSAYSRKKILGRRILNFEFRKFAMMVDTVSTTASPRLLPGVESNKVIVLAGATSVGKSKVAELLCKVHGNCEVVIADSVQIYKNLDIGSNKPSLAEQESVPHHLVDICDPNETYSSGEFVRDAVPIIYDIINRGKLPVVVGGSTMYLQWLV